MNEFPKVIIKKKNIQILIDFCLEENIEFSVRNKPFSDNDLEVELKLSDIKKALQTGMFLRENRIELEGMEIKAPVAAKKVMPVKKSKGEEAETEELLKVDDKKDLFKA